jgi:hypothetical protein
MGQNSFPGTPPFLPDPSSAGGGGQDPTKMLRFLTLLQQMKQQPDPMGATQQPQGGVVAQPRIALIPQVPTAPELGIKMDPMSSVGTLPKPNEQPGPVASPGVSNQLMSMMQPKAAATYQAIMGVSDFIGKQAQKKDESQKAEASNAAQALMSALESAKTTGDYRPAEHILENNEALFNKVYKGWLQKSEEAKKPKKQEKVDPEVQGFEAGLASYMGKGAAQQPGQPQPPSSLQGRSGARYMMPQAPPGQAIQQQQQSQMMQQQRQAPGQSPITPEERQKLQEGNLRIQELGLGVQRAQYELEKSKTDAQKAGTNLAETTKLYEDRMTLANDKFQKALFEKDAQINLLRTKIASRQGGRGPGGGGGSKGPTEVDFRKMDAISQAQAYLDDMIQKGKNFGANDVSALTGMLNTAGASSVAKALPTGMAKRWFSKPEDVSTFRDNFENYVKSFKAGVNKTAPGQSSDDAGPDDAEADDDPLGLLGGK